MEQHKQAFIYSPNYGLINVDIGIAGLLRVLWNRKINTRWSCQGNDLPCFFDQIASSNHSAYIMFDDRKSFYKFRDILDKVIISKYMIDGDISFNYNERFNNDVNKRNACIYFHPNQIPSLIKIFK